MAIFSRQVKVWTGTFVKHHLFQVGNGCDILVFHSSQARLCFRQRRREQVSSPTKWKGQKGLQDFKYSILHPENVKLSLCACRWCDACADLLSLIFSFTTCTVQYTSSPKASHSIGSHILELSFFTFTEYNNSENQ